MGGRNQTSEKRLDSSSVRKHLAGADVPGFIWLLKGKVLEPVGHKFNFSISRNCQELLEIWRKGGKKRAREISRFGQFPRNRHPSPPPRIQKNDFSKSGNWINSRPAITWWGPNLRAISNYPNTKYCLVGGKILGNITHLEQGKVIDTNQTSGKNTSFRGVARYDQNSGGYSTFKAG